MWPPKHLTPVCRRLCRGALAVVLLFPALARAAEFSALMSVKDGDKVVTGKIFVQNDKQRQEFRDAQGQTITIVRPDKKVFWVVMPLKRAYLELPLKTRLPGQFIQIPQDARGKRLVGHDRVSGYDTDKYEFTLRDGTMLERQTVWVATKLDAPIKMTVSERNFSIEYKSIKEGGVNERLFEIPPGYQKLSAPGSFDAG